MATGLLITGGGLTALALAAAITQRRREIAARRALAARHGWEFANRRPPDVLDRLQSVTLARLGHSRHVEEVFLARDGIMLCQYRFLTGFEYHRRIHRWRLVVREGEHGMPCAVVSRFDWLLAAAKAQALRVAPLRQEDGGIAATAIVADLEAWQRRLDAGLRHWLLSQPAERSWEVHPGLIVGHEPGTLRDPGVENLETSGRELAAMLAADPTA